MAYACYHCGKQVKRGQVRLVVPTRLAEQFGDFTKAYHPACYDKAEEAAGFELQQQPATQPKRATFTSTKSRQRTLLSGLDCLPNQGDLFQVDGEPEPLLRFEAGGAQFRIDF